MTEKGGLNKKKKKAAIMQPAIQVKKGDMDFTYTWTLLILHLNLQQLK